VVADEILVAAEKENGDSRKKRWEKGYCGRGVAGAEGVSDVRGTIFPSRVVFSCVDVEGFDDVLALQNQLDL